jgi:hypothetical protein
MIRIITTEEITITITIITEETTTIITTEEITIITTEDNIIYGCV